MALRNYCCACLTTKEIASAIGQIQLRDARLTDKNGNITDRSNIQRINKVALVGMSIMAYIYYFTSMRIESRS